jgi:hypothetical protein
MIIHLKYDNIFLLHFKCILLRYFLIKMKKQFFIIFIFLLYDEENKIQAIQIYHIILTMCF